MARKTQEPTSSQNLDEIAVQAVSLSPHLGSELENLSIRQIYLLHQLLVQQSVSRTAVKVNMHQAGVSAVLAKLRVQLGDPILVRAGGKMVLTERAKTWPSACETILQEVQNLSLMGPHAKRYDPKLDRSVFRIAASDFLDPLFQARLVSQLKQEAPDASIEILPLTAEFDYARALAEGSVDVVVGNWLHPPSDLHIQTLLEEEIVCLIGENFSLGAKGLDTETYLQADHIAPPLFQANSPSIIDDYLLQQGFRRKIAVRAAQFSLIPSIVAHSQLVLTSGSRFCSRFAQTLPLRLLPCPIKFPPMRYYQLWHARGHRSLRNQWLRKVVKSAARA
jgi:DNA-binding transcriptional LysR family regulator